MQSWKVLEIAIPRGLADRIGQALHLTGDYVRRWRREPLSDDAPLASGQRSPLDRFCDLLDAVFLTNPPGAEFIVDYINDYHDELLAVHKPRQFASRGERTRASMDILKESTEAIRALNCDTLSDDALRELLDLRAAVNSAIARCRAQPKGDS